MFRDQAAMHITQVTGGVHLHVHTCARADAPPFPYLENGWTDYAEIWCMVTDTLAKLFAKVNGGKQLHVRTCKCAPFPYLGNGWTGCAEIWCVLRDPLARLFANVNGGVYLHVRTYAPLFRILETAVRIALKFGMWLETHWLSVLLKSILDTCARAAVPGG